MAHRSQTVRKKSRADRSPRAPRARPRSGPTSTAPPRPATWYVDAAADKAAGYQLEDTPDGDADFNSSFPNWHFGAGNAPCGKDDFTMVVLHELGHGLGFLGAGDAQRSAGSVLFDGLPKAYDRRTETRGGWSLLAYPDGSTQLGSALRSTGVYYDSPGARLANGGRAVKLFAPSSWQEGSSSSHLDEVAFDPATRTR